MATALTIFVQIGRMAVCHSPLRIAHLGFMVYIRMQWRPTRVASGCSTAPRFALPGIFLALMSLPLGFCRYVAMLTRANHGGNTISALPFNCHRAFHDTSVNASMSVCMSASALAPAHQPLLVSLSVSAPPSVWVTLSASACVCPQAPTRVQQQTPACIHEDICATPMQDCT